MFGKFFELKNLIADTFTSKHGSSEFALKKNDYGIIYGETAMIEKIAERTAIRVKGVNNAGAVVDSPKGNLALKVRFTIGIKQDYSANEVSTNLISEVKKVLDEMCGIVATVDVKITSVKNSEIAERKRRVK